MKCGNGHHLQKLSIIARCPQALIEIIALCFWVRLSQCSTDRCKGMSKLNATGSLQKQVICFWFPPIGCHPKDIQSCHVTKTRDVCKPTASNIIDLAKFKSRAPGPGCSKPD